MTAPVHFGVTLPQIKRTWAEAKAAAQEFERLGFDSVWVCDHLFGVPAPTIPIMEGWTELTAVAAVTERVGLGSLVTPPFFRNAAVFAKQLATIDEVAGGGRVIAGLGAGWFQAEFEAYGCRFGTLRERMEALEETCAIVRGMFAEERFTFHGKHFSTEDVMCLPKPATPPQVLVGGGGENVLMGIAARHADIWNNLAANQALLATKAQAMRRRCEAEGRDPATLTFSQQTVVIIAEAEADAADGVAKASKIYGGHMGAGIEAHGIWGTPERVIECIERHRAHGVGHFVIEFFGRDTREPARLFAEAVLPHYR